MNIKDGRLDRGFSASEPYVTAKMDEHIVGAEAWDNEILWFNDPQDFYEDTEELPQ